MTQRFMSLPSIVRERTSTRGRTLGTLSGPGTVRGLPGPRYDRGSKAEDPRRNSSAPLRRLWAMVTSRDSRSALRPNRELAQRSAQVVAAVLVLLCSLVTPAYAAEFYVADNDGSDARPAAVPEASDECGFFAPERRISDQRAGALGERSPPQA